ncbi:MAG: SpoIIE family protein phosphatase [Bacteroidales bacterium]|nr:SpoIIE family protein phosphatase [Bacteroidales bacterium]
MRLLNSNSLAFKLSLYILTGVILIVIAILYYNFGVSRQLVLNHARENARNLTNSTVSKIQNVLQVTQKIPENLAYIIENTSFSETDLKRFLKMVVENNDEIFGSCVAFEPYGFFRDSAGYAPYFYKSGDSVLFKNLNNKDYDYPNQDWYNNPRQHGPVWSEPYFDEGGGNIIMSTFSVPFYGGEKRDPGFRGVVTADISLNRLDSLIKSVTIYESGYAFLLSEKGRVISHPHKEYILNETIFKSAEELNKPELAVIGNRMVNGETGFIPYRSLSLKGRCRMYFAPIPVNNWSIGVIFPEKELFAELNNLAKRLLMIGGSGIISLFLMIIIISRRITYPLRNLVKAARTIGSGHFDDPLPQIRSNDEIARLTTSFDLMRQQLKEYMLNLRETTIAKEKIESELKIAHDIQQGIIPKIFPPFPHRDDLDIYAVLCPAKEVGGDLYDFFFIDLDKLAFAVGDVSGKGVPSSLLMAITMTLFRSKTSKELKPNDIVAGINRELCRENENSMFVTFFLGIIDLKTGVINYCNAGHNYPYILRNQGDIEYLDTTHGTPLGLFTDTEYQSDEVTLRDHEFIILYTDGITEAFDSKGKLFGEQRLKMSLADIQGEISVEKITTTLLDRNRDFTMGTEQSDDITILVLSYLGPHASAASSLRGKLIIKNCISEIPKILDLIDAIGQRSDLDREMVFDVKVAVEEITANIIQYAFQDDKEHLITIDLSVDSDEIRIIITDDGKEFNPLSATPPEDFDKPLEKREIGGLGIHLVRNLIDIIQYQRRDNLNELVLIKNIQKKGEIS